jgi:putative transposase
MKPYSQDLRERAIAALEASETQAAVAARFRLHKSTLEKWWYRWQATGSCAALPHASGPERTLQTCQSFIRAEVKKQPDATLAELCERVAEAKGLSASPSMMCRELQLLELPQKKSRFTIASKKHRE